MNELVLAQDEFPARRSATGPNRADASAHRKNESFVELLSPVIKYSTACQKTKDAIHTAGFAFLPFGTLLLGKLLSNLFEDLLYASPQLDHPFAMSFIWVISAILGYGIACGVIWCLIRLCAGLPLFKTASIKFAQRGFSQCRQTMLALAEVGFLIGALEGLYFVTEATGPHATLVEKFNLIVAGGLFESIGWYVQSILAYYGFAASKLSYKFAKQFFECHLKQALQNITSKQIATFISQKLMAVALPALLFSQVCLCSWLVYNFRPFAIDLYLLPEVTYHDAVLPALITLLSCNYTACEHIQDLRFFWHHWLQLPDESLFEGKWIQRCQHVTLIKRVLTLLDELD